MVSGDHRLDCAGYQSSVRDGDKGCRH